MAKTVFGMPGIGKKPSEGGAPKAGTPAATGGGAGGTAQNSGKGGPKPAVPAMAKPVNAPMATPTGGAAGAVGPAAGGAKTVFGMPALKVPKKGAVPAAQSVSAPAAQSVSAPKAQPVQAYGETQAMSATSGGARGASVPAPPPAPNADEKLAFKETVMGLAAAGGETHDKPAEASIPKTEAMPATGANLGTDATVAAGEQSAFSPPADAQEIEVPTGDASWTGHVADVPMDRFTAGTTDGSISAPPSTFGAGTRKKSGGLPKMIAGVVFAALVLAVVAMYFLGDSGAPTPKVPPTLPPAYNPNPVAAQPQAPAAPAAAVPASPAGAPAQ